MNGKSLKVALFILIAISAGAHAATNSWSYFGSTGPEHWAEIDPSFSTCATGKTQSPIDINTYYTFRSSSPSTITYQYNLSDDRLEEDFNSSLLLNLNGQKYILNDAHSLQINIDDPKKNDFITWNKENYQLRQFHFHAPSENRIDHRAYPLEVHFVHQSDKGQLVVIAVFISLGQENSALAEIINHAPVKHNLSNSLPNTFNISQLIPPKSNYYNFTGSLTTPPCGEPIQWLVMSTPITASVKQILEIQKLLGRNARPVQDLNGRKVTEYRQS